MDTAEFEEPFRAILDDLVVDGVHLYDSLRPYMNEPWNTLPFEITIADRPELNAVTKRCENKYFICIYRGAVEQVFGTMLGLFSCPTFMPEIGNALVEKKPIEPVVRGFPPMPLLSKTSGPSDSLGVYIPNDPDRLTTAHMLAHIALHFLVCHEIGHIVGGHHELRRTLRMGDSISEIHGGNCSDQSRLLQILECDADAFAGHVTSTVQTDKRMEKLVSEIVKASDWSPNDCTHIAYLAAVAILFRVLSAGAPTHVVDSVGSHPHPAVRALIVGSCMLARSLSARQASAADAEALSDTILGRSIGNIEDVWAELWLPGQVCQPREVWAAGVREGGHSLFVAYEAERAALEEYAHLPRSWHDWNWPI